MLKSCIKKRKCGLRVTFAELPAKTPKKSKKKVVVNDRRKMLDPVLKSPLYKSKFFEADMTRCDFA
jgi:hypothetical protein